MRKTIWFAVLFLFSIIFFKCVDDVSVVDTSKKHTGKLVLKSKPDSAKIFLLGTNTNKITPDSIMNLESGNYDVTLKLNNYFDTSFDVKVFDNLRTEKFLNLKSQPSILGMFVNSVPAGAEIFLSNKTTGKHTPDSLVNLDEGIYFLTLKLEGYKDTTFNIDLSQNKKITKNISLTKSEFGGSIFIESEPGNAQIILLDKNTGLVTPDSLTNLKDGSYQISLKLDGYKDSTFSLDVKKDKRTNANIILTDSVPSVAVVLTYSKIQYSQILFNFYFNQDINLDTVEVLKPNGADKSSFNFGDEFVGKGEQRLIIFSQPLIGKWSFSFSGKKARGKKADFKVAEDIEVE